MDKTPTININEGLWWGTENMERADILKPGEQNPTEKDKVQKQPMGSPSTKEIITQLDLLRTPNPRLPIRNTEPGKEESNINRTPVVQNPKTLRWLEVQQSRSVCQILEPEKEKDTWTKRWLNTPQLRMTDCKPEGSNIRNAFTRISLQSV